MGSVIQVESDQLGLLTSSMFVFLVRECGPVASHQVRQISHRQQETPGSPGEECNASLSGPCRKRGLLVLYFSLLQGDL